MGLATPALRYLIREHARKPFTGPVLTLGRQCMYVTLGDVQALMRAEGLEPRPLVSEADRYTNIPSWQDGPQARFTSDRAFWQVLADLDVTTLDVSTYEEADIICDLNQPLPAELEHRFDLIVDGGTLEHVFDVRQALMNINRMLRPGGRIIHMSPASNYLEHGFYQFSPTAFFDYYGTNGFAQPSCLVADQDAGDPSYHEWAFRDWNPLRPQAILSPHPLLLIFRAEKQADSTVDRIPQQGEYRRLLEAREGDRERRERFARVLDRLRDARPKQVAIYGAGDHGRFLAGELQRLGIPVACMVDSRPSLWGKQLEGIEVVALERAIERNPDAYVIGSLASADAIAGTIERAYGALGHRPMIVAAA